MYKLTDIINKDIIIVDKLVENKIYENYIYFNKIIKIIEPFKGVNPYGANNYFASKKDTIIEEVGNTKIGEILYGKSN